MPHEQAFADDVMELVPPRHTFRASLSSNYQVTNRPHQGWRWEGVGLEMERLAEYNQPEKVKTPHVMRTTEFKEREIRSNVILGPYDAPYYLSLIHI